MKRTPIFFIIAFALLALAIMPSARTEVNPAKHPTPKNAAAPAAFKPAPIPPPTVSLTSPFNNAQFLAGATIRLSADAADSDGTISKVEFFQGAVKLGEDTTAPYSYDWSNVAAGDYVLTAKATDNQSQTTTASAINIAVLGQVKQLVGWSAITNGTDLGNGSVRKTSTGAWDFSAIALQTLLAGDGFFESTAANFNQSISLTGANGQGRAIVVGSGGWVGIYEGSTEVAATVGHIPSETITPHGAGDRYRIEVVNSVLRYIRYRGAVREVMFQSAAALPTYPMTGGLGMSPQNAEWQKTVLAQLTRKATWSAIANGIDLGNGSVRKTSTGTWDFSATAAQTLARGDGYFESTASNFNHSINATGSDGAGRSLIVGTGGWAAIYEGGVEVASTSPLGNLTAHAAGDRYRLEISGSTFRYVRYRGGIRTIIFTSPNAMPGYPISFSLGMSFQNTEWQDTVFAQLSNTVTWTSITNGIDLGNGSVRKTSTGTWDFSASARQQLVGGPGYFESTASYWNHSINLGGVDGASRTLLAGTGGWAAIYENGAEVASTSPLGNLTAHAAGDRYRMEMIAGKLRYVRYRSGVRMIAFTSTNPVPAYPLGFSLGMSFQNSEWQNTMFSDNVPEHNDAAFVMQSVPATMTPGQMYNVIVVMRNTGPSTWTPDGDYQLGSENLPDNTRWGPSRVNLNAIVRPGEEATFSFMVTAPAAGSHSFQWRMVQNGVQRFGALTTNVNVQTVNFPPTVSLTSPTQGQTFTAPATVSFAATASDSDGTITKVEFFQGAVKVGEDTTSPYTFDWTNVPAAIYVLTARATDNSGATATSSSVNITVNPPNQLPTVSLTAPTSGQVFSAPANITLTANAADSDGLVTKVQFFRGGTTLIGEDTSAPFSFAWNNVAAGNYSLTAKAFDNAGATTTSAAVSITVNALPSVSLTAPTSGQVFTAPANVTLTATASDTDGAITKVQFFQGTTLLNEDTSAPYSFNWNNVSANNYSLTATAFDNLGGTTTSAAIPITVNALPTVSLTAPTSGQIFAAPANITLTASAADANGTITKVQFFQGTTLLNEDLTAPYSFAWNNVSANSYSLTAKAFDNHGGTTTSAAIPIIVNTLPTVSLTAPTSGQIFTAPANITLTASASDANGTIAKVQFFEGTTLLNEDTSAPYSFAWNNVSANNYSLTAKAFDNHGGTTTSTTVAISVNTVPTVSITSPTHPTTFTAPATFTINATASDPDGSITKVEFFAGVGLLGQDTTAPYTLNMNNLSSGVYVLTATATDNLGGTKTSTAVSAVVTNAPTTSITGPANNSSFLAGSNININANASDDGSINKVEFFKNGVLLGQDTASPYSFAWNNVPPGTYSLTTRATDDLGVTGNSSAVTINVVSSSLVSRLDPGNRTGGGGENPLSRNYNWNVPLIDLPGRAGMDLGLSLSYNSLVWTKTGNFVTFNDDAGFPSPGFRLGFPVIQGPFFNSEANKNAYLLITPDGSRIELRHLGGQSTKYESVDSSHLLLDTTTMMLRTTDGTRLSYISYGGEFKCIQIMDRNGNFITVTYLSDGRINTVVDTLGRTLTFNYHPTELTLTSITQTWAGQSEPYVWASFTYVDTEVQTGFNGSVTKLGPANGLMLKTLRSVILNDNSRFDFDHTKWLQVSKISRYAADGHLLNYRSYNLPANGSTQLDDCPRFTERRDWAENFNRGGSLGTTGLPSGLEEEVLTGPWTDPANASWTLPDGTNESGVVVQMTLADGTYDKIYFANTAGWKRGLLSKVETYGKTTPDAPTPIIQRRKVNMWTQDDENALFLLNPRVKETHTYDFDNSGEVKNHARTRTTYVVVNFGDGTSCNFPEDVFEYQANASTVLRRTHTDYLTPAGTYITARVVGLPSESRMYEVNPDGTETLISRIAFAYDESGSIVSTDPAIQPQHDNTAYGTGFVTGRGNLSSVTRYNTVNGQSTVTRAKYNTAGSPRKSIDALGHEVNIDYADSFSDGVNRNTFAYPTSVTDADNFTATSQYNFNFGRITRTQTPPPGINTVGPIKNFIYDSKTRLEKIAIEINGNADYSHTRFEYPNSQNRIDAYTTIEAGQGEALAFKLFDGHGRAIATASAHPGSSGGYSAKLMLYDKLGRTIKESNSTETNVSGSFLNWSATGDDNPSNGGSGWVYTSQTYDWNSRPLTMTNTDGTTKIASYDGCSCAGGDSVTLTSEGTAADGTIKRRQQKTYRDILGRITRTEKYNWDGTGPNGTNGTVYSTTFNTYNARDQLTRARKFQGAAPADPNAATCQSESLRFGTDNTWKQTQNHTPGWWNLGFDDSSWSQSVDEGAYNTSPWGAGSMPSDTPARWIWYHDTRFGSGDTSLVYFRKQFIATSTSATLTLRADNIFVAYLNGVQIAEGNQWQVTHTINLTLTPGSTYVLGVEVLNQGGPGGLIADVKSIGTTCEQATMTYDGHGRLKTRHVPGQDLNGATTYNYDDDDTVTSTVDARGATTTFSHANNNRHLVTGITYTVPGGSGITDPADVSYGYDAAGNRISMSDGMGTMSYQYDQLSRVSSETRQFIDPNAPFLNASYQLSYEYNLANQPKKITDHTNMAIKYNYDQVGRLASVMGENNLYAGVSTYASSATYRAWGALRGVTFGNNYSTAIKYNARLQGTEFEVSGRPAQFGSSTVMNTQYSYYDDGGLKFAHDTLDERFDRAYSYDNANRLKEAYTGSEARDYRDGTNSGTATGPYRQSYQYDVYDHITQRTNRFWSQSDSFNSSYANNRRQDPAFQYDAEGNLTKDSDLNYIYDAANRNITIFDFLGTGSRTSTLSYDGDGRQLKKSVSQSGVTTVTYYVRSSVLGGRVVTELNGQGIKQKGFVFAGRQEIARQENNVVVWQHVNPLTGSSGESRADGSYLITNEPDPMGVNVGTEDPFSGLLMEGFEPTPERPMLFSLGDEGGGCSFTNPNCTTCTLDGFSIGCDRAMHLVDIGAADILVTLSDGRRVQVSAPDGCPLGICRVWIPEQSGNSSMEIDDSGETPTVRTNNSTAGFWDVFSFDFLPQTSQGPTLPKLPSDQIDKLREGISNLSDKCKEFLTNVFKEMGDTYKTKILDLFNAVAKKGGFYDSSSIEDAQPGYAPVGADNKAPRIELDLAGIAEMTDSNPAALLMTVVHELTHANRKGGGTNSHWNMARAAFAVAGKMGVRTDMLDGPKFFTGGTAREEADVDAHNSSVFNRQLHDFCFSETK